MSYGANTPTVTLTDSRGNTYASAQPVTRWNGSQWSAQVFYAKNVAGGANTVTAQFSSNINSFGILYIHEYSGIDPEQPARREQVGDRFVERDELGTAQRRPTPTT